MATIDALFNPDQRRKVAQAVAQAESKTSVEIVPVVARTSGRYDRAEDVAGLWCGVLLMVLSWWLYPLPVVEPGEWGGTPAVIQLLCMIASLVAGFFIGAIIAARVSALRRLFTPAIHMREEVQAKARAVFFDHRVHHTVGGSGLLIYVSLYEHQAAVLADQATLEKLGGAAVQALCDDLTAGLKKGDITEALCATIAGAGDRLGAAMPRPAGDINELADALVVIE